MSTPLLSISLADRAQRRAGDHPPQAGASDFCDMVVDQFDEMLEQCERHPLVMNVSVHI
jgi:hypothetical protein